MTEGAASVWRCDYPPDALDPDVACLTVGSSVGDRGTRRIVGKGKGVVPMEKPKRSEQGALPGSGWRAYC